ncbi:MAG: hypothetical protein VYC34_02580 [Planctomycetota bacterium]|nr:hypothetical protein [Planctomycetota bacterium]
MARCTFGRILVAAAASAVGFGNVASADFARLPWDVPCCFICDCPFGIASVNLTICNCTDVPATYTWNLKDAPGGPMGLLQFNPPQGTVMLPPGECTNIPITICCSPNLQIGFPAVYQVNVVNQTTGNTFSALGSVVFTGQTKLEACDPTVPVEPGVPALGGFVATNMSGQPADIFVQFEAMGGLPVEISPREVQLTLPPKGDAITIPLQFLVEGTRRGDGQPQFIDVLASWDQNGDGVPEVGSSIGLRIVAGDPCPADLNGDGLVNAADLGGLLGAWGPCP